MHRMQIEIYSNLEAYVCLSYDAMTTKAIFQMKTFFVNIFGKPVSNCVATFRLRCLPARKRCKVSLNLGDLRWFCLFFSTNERTAVGISLGAAFYLFFIARVSTVFVKDAAPLLTLISFNPNKISLYTCLRSHFSPVYLKEKKKQRVLGLFSHVLFFLSLEWMRSCTNVDAFSKVWHTSTGFPKRCNRILISEKDVFKTHLKEV